MARLFGRRIAINAAGVLITEHEAAFAAESSLGSDPDEASVRIYNLVEDMRNRIAAYPDDAQLDIQAGYIDPGPSSIYLGQIRRVQTTREGPDIITTVEASGAVSARSATRRLDKSYGKGSNLRTIIQDLITATGLGPGNVSSLYTRPEFVEKYNAPYTASGPAWDQLTAILHSRGYHITTQRKQVVVKSRKNLGDTRIAALLTPTTGLIGQPSVDNAGVLTCETLMLPDITPGVLIQLQSEFAQGTYTVTNTTHKGSLYGTEYGIMIEARPI